MNMKTIVIYTSKYGSTKKYAQWIAEELKCPVKKLCEVTAGETDSYDAIIYGGGIYASGISGFKKFLSKLSPENNKKYVLFMVGMTNPAEKNLYAEIAERNLTAKWKDRFKVFALRGDQLFSKMSGMDKLLMRVPKAIAEKKPESERTADDKHFLENFGRDIIFSDKGQIEPIINYLRGGNL